MKLPQIKLSLPKFVNLGLIANVLIALLVAHIIHKVL